MPSFTRSTIAREQHPKENHGIIISVFIETINNHPYQEPEDRGKHQLSCRDRLASPSRSETIARMAGLILGSTSGYRRALMERLQVPFTCEAPGVDEQDVKQLGHKPMVVVEELARRKATAVFDRNPTCVVIGSDQAAVLDDDLLDKPKNRAGAIQQLHRLRGREHRLITAVAIAHDKGLTEFCDITRLIMRDLTDQEIARYVDAEKPFDCAGSYKIEQLGITLFEHIDSRDHTAIIGLPLLQLTHELRKIGVPLP